MTVTALRKSKLVAVSPETVEPKKPKILLFGPPGVGKTWFSLSFPSAFYIDTEGGADLAHYRKQLKEAGAMYMGPDQGSLDFETVISQAEALATEKHAYRTIVIDSITKLFNTAISDEQLRLGDSDAFGASKKAPIRQMTRLLRWLNKCDLNVIMIAHQKDEWGMVKGNREVIGQTPDCWDKLNYELHLVMRAGKLGAGEKAQRFAFIGKSRLTGFPEGSKMELSYPVFAQAYGKDVIEKEAVPVVLATAEQIAELNKLLEVVKLPDGTIEKWLAKADCESFDKMDTDKIANCIKFLRDKTAS